MANFFLPEPQPEPAPPAVDPLLAREAAIVDGTRVEALKNDYLAREQELLHTGLNALLGLNGRAALDAVESTLGELSRVRNGVISEADDRRNAPGNDLEIMSDVSPEPMEDGQQYAPASSSGSRPPTRRVGGRPLTQMEEMREWNFNRHLDALRELEPSNKELTRLTRPNWVPSEDDIAKIHEELLSARQRAAETAASTRITIGIGKYAGEHIPARSEKRDFTAEERAEMNRIGSQTGCHTCGTTSAGTKYGNFIPDHQPPSRLNPPGGPQSL